jgi:hypothetical protein
MKHPTLWIRIVVPALLLQRRCLQYVITLFVVVTPISGSHCQNYNKPIAQPELQGKIIRSIKINLSDVFEGNDIGPFYRAVNAIKIGTRQEVIRRELRFAVGDPYDEFHVQESGRQLRTLRFLRDVVIRGFPEGEFVDIVVNARESWTFVPRASASSTSGKNSSGYGLVESNILGFGKRAELLNRRVDNRQTLETVWDDPRFLGTYTRLVTAYFDRNDGERVLLLVDRPFLSFVDKFAWNVGLEGEEIVGRLFEDGEEEYIFRQDGYDFNSRFTVAVGDPEVLRTRYSMGFRATEANFAQAQSRDFANLDLDPAEVSNNPLRLPVDRRFVGPTFGFQSVVPNFISMNYIDRFDRFEDYNLGKEFSFDVHMAPAVLGSRGNNLLLTGNRSFGEKYSQNSFLRFEAGFSTRVERESVTNSLVRAELKFFKVLGPLFVNQAFWGRHTLASQAFLDLGDELDNDRQFLQGGDVGLRGYKARAFQGDKRYGINLEDRIHLIDDLFRLVSVGGVAFFDMGGATSEPFTKLALDRTYADVGVGLRFGFTRSSGGGVVRLDIAVPIRDGREGSESLQPRFILSAGQAFEARTRSETFGPDKANVEVGFDE